MSQKQTKSPTPSSIFRAAFERLSFRSRRKKEIKYDLVIEQKQKVIADVDKNEHDFDLVTQDHDTKSDVSCENTKICSQNYPSSSGSPSVSTNGDALINYKSRHDNKIVDSAIDVLDKSLRDAASFKNKTVDNEWAKLSGSMMSLTSVGIKKETMMTSSNMSLDARSPETESEGSGSSSGLDRAKSVTILTSTDTGEKIPDNQLQQLNGYQRRILSSMEKLSLPAWYKSSSSIAGTPKLPCSNSTPTALTSSWKTTGSSHRGWRREHSVCSTSRSSTLDRTASLISGSNRTRMMQQRSTSSSSSQAQPVSTKPVYLGWRSQERLDIGPSYLTSPAQRLASSVIEVKDKIGEKRTTASDVQTNIKQVTDAIMDFCKTSGDDTPILSDWNKDIDDEENIDDDSGIDRSEDFTREVLNEITVANGKSMYSF